MPQFKCLAGKTRHHSSDSQTDLIGELCPVCGSLSEPVGDWGEIVGDRVIETRGSTLHSVASGAGQLLAGRVGEIIVRRELKHARVRLKIERYNASPQEKPLALTLPAPATTR